MPEIYVGEENEYEEGGRKVITTDNLEIGVFRIKGEFHAYENFCAHMGGPGLPGADIQKSRRKRTAGWKKAWA